MSEFLIKLQCPQTHKDCVGKEKCKLDRSKGCAVEALELMKIKNEEYDEFVPWYARM